MYTIVRAKDRGLKLRHGFTLIELLVVVAIIAVLISILLPAISNARKVASTVSCASNLRQIGLGFQYYTDTYNEYYPPHWGAGPWRWPPSGARNSTWQAFIAVYLGWNGNTQKGLFSVLPVYRCPSDKISQFDGATYEVLAGGNLRNVSYGYNHTLFSSAANFRKIRKSEIAEPELKVLVADSDPTGYEGAILIYCDWLRESGISLRHSDGNILFADGHVALQKRKKINGLDYIPWTPPWRNDVFNRYWYQP